MDPSLSFPSLEPRSPLSLPVPSERLLSGPSFDTAPLDDCVVEFVTTADLGAVTNFFLPLELFALLSVRSMLGSLLLSAGGVSLPEDGWSLTSLTASWLFMPLISLRRC